MLSWLGDHKKAFSLLPTQSLGKMCCSDGVNLFLRRTKTVCLLWLCRNQDQQLKHREGYLGAGSKFSLGKHSWVNKQSSSTIR